MHRATQRRLVAGVAAGTAQHLGLSVRVVRLAFVLLAFAGGAGLAMYAALWVFVPQARPDESAGEPRQTREDGKQGRVQLVAIVALGFGTLILLQTNGLSSPALLPLFVIAGGVALVWAQSDQAQRTRWREAGLRGGRTRNLLVVGAGALLVVVGLIGFLATRGQLREASQGLLSAIVIVLGLAVVSGPWWLRFGTDLREERRQRIRSQERAEVAAHVHDSVLQTLALIRKASDDPREVSRLARNQERELRGWLYEPKTPAGEAVRFAAAIEQAAAEVELAHGITVETVVVGDTVATPALLALVAALREALTNAAKHSGAETVAVYVEVGPDGVEAFVRDRGTGFDAGSVDSDRYGISQSIVGRMQRHGGQAQVRSTPGNGTEVRLHLAVTAPAAPSEVT